jgi:hypothetical protein
MNGLAGERSGLNGLSLHALGRLQRRGAAVDPATGEPEPVLPRCPLND